MEPLHYPIVIVVGILAGFLNTVAGGGSLITLPLLIFLGLPGTVANATNRVAILTQNITAVGGFHSKGVRLPFPYVIYLAIASMAGGFIGAELAVNIRDDVFNRILAVVMIVVVIMTLRQTSAKGMRHEENLSRSRQVIGIISFFLLAIYGGFLQAGIGFVVIALVTSLHHFNLVKTNYLKVFAALLYTAVAVVVFAWEGKIRWDYGIILAVGQGIGGWYASRWSVDKGEKWIKRILVVAVVILAVNLWFF